MNRVDSGHALIRPATDADAVEVLALDQVAFGADAWSERTVLTALTGAGGATLVADGEGSLLGFAVAAASGDVWDLHRIVVRPGERREGLGSALLDAVRERAPRDCTRLMLEVSAANTGAVAFYQAHGMVEVARRTRYYRDGADALVLSLALQEGTR